MPSASSDKTTLAYQPPNPAPGPPLYTPPAGPPQGYQQPPPPQGYAPQASSPGYAPQPQPQAHPSQRSAAQIGEEYRAQLYAQCAQGIHQPTTKYGLCGLICAIVFFPIGLICLFTDTEQKCDRCGIKLS
ncbi:hypothetical protein B0H10DRAFT_2010503 [Mycena sp. CBHHK59/15]|nr:hypothetical protein B0H10DRAFT_2010503 [Mycena sp. CBHHK59/15]